MAHEQEPENLFMHCFHYDHCDTELLDKPEERLDELKNLAMAAAYSPFES
jgi:hypothetical protein